MFHGDRDHPFFTTLVLTGEEIAGIKAYAKRRGASLNDMILAAYAWALHARTGLNRIILPCPVDLRKYIPETVRYGICNLTSNFICDITVYEADGFDGVLGQIRSQIQAQKSSDTCLKPVLSLEIASRLIPFPVMREKFKQSFTVPIVSYTNLGIIDAGRLTFANVAVAGAYMTGAVKYAPYFQISVSTYRDACTLSSNMYGTDEDKLFIEQFLADVKKALVPDTA